MDRMPGKLFSRAAAHAIYTKGEFMLRSIKQLYGNKLGASDGEIGHVKDFYFDDQNWAVRYTVFISLTKEAVEQSPAHHLAPVGAAD